MNSKSSVDLITVGDTAEILRISESGVRRLIEKRCIPFYKVMGSIRFDREDVMEYLAGERVEHIG